MKLELISFTAAGGALAGRLAGRLNEAGHQARASSAMGPGGVSLRDWTAKAMASAGGLIFIGAAAIAVRAVAPYIRGKTVDPAVISLDEQGRFVVPLLSGHLGGANGLARQTASLLGAQAVVSTATDINNLFAVDSWAVGQGLRVLNPGRIKEVSARLLAGRPVGLYSQFSYGGTLPPLVEPAIAQDCRIYVGCSCSPCAGALVLVPPAVTAGVGCRRGTEAGAIARAIGQACRRAGIYREAVGQVCSIDCKAQEPGLLKFCGENHLPLHTFSPQALSALEGDFSSSSFVRETVGVDNVCERSALLGSGGRLILKKQALDGVTTALALAPWPLAFEEAP